ncbi:MAG: heparinase II/III family protein, partial [Dongiaceae bacterium]
GGGRRATDFLARAESYLETLPTRGRSLLKRHMLAPLHGSAIYRWWLGRNGSDKEPLALAVAIVPGDERIGRQIAALLFEHDGERIDRPAPLANPPGASEGWRRWLDGFGWLADLAELGPAARQPARQLVDRWIAENPPATGLAWRPDIAGQRLVHWLQWQGIFLSPVPADFRARYLRSVHLHKNHLAATIASAPAGSGTISALKGLLFCALALKDESLRIRMQRRLDTALARQLLPDGMQIERSPASQLAILRDLAEIAGAHSACGREPPTALTAAMHAMIPALQMFRHGDGGLALFNDSTESENGTIERVLAATGGGRSALDQAPSGGFQRLARGSLVAILDAGRPAPPGFDSHAHAGTLALEVSIGRERLIVNCGAHPWHPDWRLAQRYSAAHSTLVIDDTGSSQIRSGRGIGQRPMHVVCRREELDGQIWIDASHDGYRPKLGVTHRRRLYLTPDGEDLRGEDIVEGRGGANFALRFHLHPDVDASLAQGGSAALLRLPSGQGWRLRIAGGTLTIEESAYLGRRGQIQRTMQVVASGPLEGDATIVRWALMREDTKKRPKR